MTTSDATPVAPRWQDPALPLADRVELLLAEMTLEEKIAQLGSRWIGNDMRARPRRGAATSDATLNVAPMQESSRRRAAVAGGGEPARARPPHPGLRQRPGDRRRRRGGAGPAAAASSSTARACGIPALVHEECLTGFTTFGATVYPAAIAWGATFDPDLVERMAAAIGRDMAAVGVHQGLSPVLDVVRDYRWGRVEETMGEDPYLVSMLGAAYVRGLQSAGVIATLKHFAGYSASRAARNHGPVSMGRRELHGRHPAAVRDGRGPRRRRLGDELLLRRRRGPRRRGPLAAHRPAA